MRIERSKETSSIETIRGTIRLILLFHPALGSDSPPPYRREYLARPSPRTVNSLHPSFPISLSVYLRRVAFPSYHRLCPRHPLRLSTRSPRLALRNLSDSLFPAICLCLPYFRDTFQYEHLARVAHSPRFVSLRLASLRLAHFASDNHTILNLSLPLSCLRFRYARGVS